MWITEPSFLPRHSTFGRRLPVRRRPAATRTPGSVFVGSNGQSRRHVEVREDYLTVSVRRQETSDKGLVRSGGQEGVTFIGSTVTGAPDPKIQTGTIDFHTLCCPSSYSRSTPVSVLWPLKTPLPPDTDSVSIPPIMLPVLQTSV